MTGRPANGAYALYTVIPADKIALLPPHTSFNEGDVVPFAVEAVVCAVCTKEPGPCMPDVSTPALGLPYPKLESSELSTSRTLVVYRASSSVGSTTTQIAAATRIYVVEVAGERKHGMVKRCGASQAFEHKNTSIVEDVVGAVNARQSKFVGIFDAISTPETYARNLAILKRLGGGHLACVHPPPVDDVPSSVKTGMIFAVATPQHPSGVTSLRPPWSVGS